MVNKAWSYFDFHLGADLQFWDETSRSETVNLGWFESGRFECQVSLYVDYWAFFERGIIDAATVLKIREDPLVYRGHANYS